jgi:ribosomal protein S18 acetylase RimI-like enzyme
MPDISPPAAPGHSISVATDADLRELLALMRAYCEFYEVAPSDAQLLEVSRALLDAPQQEGVQLVAREQTSGEAVGFATLFWGWSTTAAGRIGTMHDLYVSPRARGRGVADALIEACAERCAEHGAVSMQWQTAPENLRAQAVYDRVGGVRERWLSYELAIPRDQASGRRQGARMARGREVD